MDIRLSRVSVFLSVLLLIYGCFLVWRRYDTRYSSYFSKNATRQLATIPLQPQRIIIPSIGVNLPIIPSNIVGGKWETTDIGVSYLARSPRPGEYGNSILYGHNWPAILGKLHTVSPGEKLTIRYSNNITKQFTINYIATVGAKDLEVLRQTRDRRITLYTCTGFLDSKRLVITAILDDNLLTYTPETDE